MSALRHFFAAIDKKWILAKMNKHNASKCIFIIYNSTTITQNFADESLRYEFSAGPNCVKITVERESAKSTETYSREFLPSDLKIMKLERELIEMKKRFNEVEQMVYN